MNTVMENEKELKILMLEDSDDDRGLIEYILRKDKLSFVARCVNTRDEFNDAIRGFSPDVVLSDHGLPGFNSAEALEICIKQQATIPFILVTGTVSDEYAISCLRNGADDYILKSNLSRLPTAIRGAVRKRKVEKLKREARHALRRRNEELVKVNQELDNFVYSVSHNLRGPLASVMGLLNVAKEIEKNPELAGIHEMMESSVLKLDDTLREIIDYSRNARNEIDYAEVNWKALIENAFRKLEYLHAEHYLNKFIDLDIATPFFSDAGRLAVILSNLLSNAIAYRESHREPIIGIDISTTEKNAVIVIKDNGIGIKPEILPEVYKMFYRGTERSHGSGLGLYIVKQILQRLNGTIAITSEVGVGTTVTIALPNMRHQSFG
ncbi:hybrid sensor histidine kinase/response regulator [Chryseolinea soli]|uniref:histidine kinase n=2 Tax=Chryseolinea soli TaxID=2321403 RepID=A0A385SDN7_9BACT|nr:hybrid sensor histidine kinase/response regulator [Chryseolinea soli]